MTVNKLNEIKQSLHDWLIPQYISAQEYSLVKFCRDKETIGYHFGLYVLIWNEEIVYAGKVSGKVHRSRRIIHRLKEHLLKLSISKIDQSEIYCKAIPILEKSLILSLEDMLIDHLQPPWNVMDFGCHNYGQSQNRKKKRAWDLKYMPGV